MDQTFFGKRRFTINAAESTNQNFEHHQYFEISLQKIKSNDKEVACLKFTDVTYRIKYDKIEGKQHILETINATVSHEMRNPINAILSQNIKIEHCLNLLDNILEEDTSIQEMKKKVKEVLVMLKKSNKV